MEYKDIPYFWISPYRCNFKHFEKHTGVVLYQGVYFLKYIPQCNRTGYENICVENLRILQEEIGGTKCQKTHKLSSESIGRLCKLRC